LCGIVYNNNDRSAHVWPNKKTCQQDQEAQ